MSDIGRKVIKLSGKPFKSRLKTNTIKGTVTNPNTNKLAYEFFEDNSCVDTEKCQIVEVENETV